jgi:hypothetical protein
VKLERVGPASFRVTLHAVELASLTSAAKWVVEGAEGELAPEALAQLRVVVAGYDAELAQLNKRPS